MTTKLSISEVTTRDWTLAQDVQGYLAAGIPGIGLWRDKLDLFGAERGLQLLHESGLQVTNLINSGYVLGMTRSQTARAIEDMVEAINLAQRVQATCLLIVTGDVGSFFRSVVQARQITIDALREVAPVAEAAGVRLGIEPIHERYPGYTFLHDIPATLDIIDAVGSPNVGLLFDTDHLWQSPGLFEQIALAGPHIFGVHINDWPVDPAPGIDRCLLGRGIIPLREILHAIDATGYRGFYDVEIMSERVWAMDYCEILADLRAAFASFW